MVEILGSGDFCLCPSPLPFPRGPWSSSWTVKFSDAVACSFADSIGGPFPVTSHRCHHKQKYCPPVLPGGGLPATPLLFHPHTKGSQILMDLSHKAVKRQASFCNAITFSNRPVLIYEQVRLKVGPPSLFPSLRPPGASGRSCQAPPSANSHHYPLPLLFPPYRTSTLLHPSSFSLLLLTPFSTFPA